MASSTEFCLLGTLLVRNGQSVVAVPRGKLRVMLAALLLDANQVVPVDMLAEAAWGQHPPPSARVTVQNNVMRLRKALGDGGGSRISTQPRGYLIQVTGSELDLTQFESLVRSAQAAARENS